MKFLFIKLKHIGDTLLLTPTVNAVRQAYPDAVIWVLVRKGCEGILAGCPAIDRTLTAAAPEKDRRSLWNWWSDLTLAAAILREGFDYAFELGDGDRGRWLTLLCGARRRCANAAGKPLNRWWRKTFTHLSHFYWYQSHQVEKDFMTVSDCLPAPLTQSIPPLCFDRNFSTEWPPGLHLHDFVVLHPGTRWPIKRWPVQYWRELCARLLERIQTVILSSGPDIEEIRLAEYLREACPERIVSTKGQASWTQLAWLLGKARLFVGVDTAAMHLSAACSCPMVALFIGSRPVEWAPWQVRHIILQPSAGEEHDSGAPSERLLVADVLQACDRLLNEGKQPR